MAGSLLLLLDDIATVLDDVAAMTKLAAKKTAGVLGDDLALNAKQVAGVEPARELDVVWSVARGSGFNKIILVPAALAISWAAPRAIPPLLIIGGCFLCYEGAEKLLHRFLSGSAGEHHPTSAGSEAAHGHAPATDERRRIAAANRTDFILSAEIIVLTLGVVAGKPLVTQLAVLAAISILMTVGVYGLVAGIVKLDDLGAMLATVANGFAQRLGRGILLAAPWLMRSLSVAGTAAMFLVGGGIIAHSLPAVHDMLHDLAPHGWLTLFGLLADAAVGLVAGFLLVGGRAVLAWLNPIGVADRPH
jgi:predicted DNA repair protein MutK